MSSQLSNSLAISNVSMLTAHLKAVSNPLNLFSTTNSPPPLLKTTIKEGSKSLLNYSNQLLLPRSNYLNSKNWNQLNFNYDTNSSENFLAGNYLSQYLGQYKNIDYNTSLKLIDYSNNLTQNNYEKNELDEQALDLSKSNRNQQKNLKQEELKKTNLLIKINKRPSSLPNQSKSLTQIKKKNISSVKKPIRKMIFDEHKSSPVSGTFILNDDDAAWDAESCATRASDIDPRINLVQVTPEAIAELEKIENQIGDYICKLCKLRFEDAFKLAQHSCSRIGHIEYKCPECEKKFNCPANLASHRRWHKPSIKNSTDALSKSQNSSKTETKKLSNSLNISHEKLINSNLNSPSGKCSPQLIIDSNERTQKTIKLQDQIVSVSVIQDSIDNQVKISNNKVKVTGTAIIPEQSSLPSSENEKSIENELINKLTNENESNIKEKLNDNYCPKKFRRQQYLTSKSPKSENQENEMINCNTSLSENEDNSNSSEILQTSLILQRKKRALSSVTTDENNLQLLKTEDVDEQVFIEQNSHDSSNSFESQKKFLISKKLKSEQN